MRMMINRFILRFAKACIRFGIRCIEWRDDLAFLRFRMKGKGYHLFAFEEDNDLKAAKYIKYLQDTTVRQMEDRHETDL